jgi:transposase
VAASKKNALKNGWLVFIDESGFSESGVVRHTWAPRGKTPVLKSKGNSWKRMSMIGAIGYRADGSRSRLFMRLKRGAVHAEQFVTFLAHLQRQMRGKIIVIWDNLHGHRGKLVRQWAQKHPRCRLTYLPAYAPELNPVEALWAWLKGTRLANNSRENLDPLAEEVRRGARAARRQGDLLQSFLHRSGLFL